MIWWHVAVVMAPFAVLYTVLEVRHRRDGDTDSIATAEQQRERVAAALDRRYHQ